MRRTLLVFLFAGCLAPACGGGQESTPPDTAPATATPPAAATADPNVVKVDPTMLRDLRITTQAVESRRGGESTTLLGELAVNEGAYAQISTPAPARVERLHAALGEVVTSGQLLVELSSPELGRASADYLSAETRVALAEAAVKRKRELAAEKIAPLREVQEAEAELANAQAGQRSAAATLASFGVPMPKGSLDASAASRFGVRSPVTGTVITRTAVLGQMADPAVPLYRIANLSTLWLTVHAFERDAVRIASGASARVSFPALPARDFQGRIALVGREVSTESRTVPVRIEIRNPDGVLRPGMSASAAVPVGVAEAAMLTVPVAAVQRVRNEWCVFIPKEAGVYEVRKIGRGRDLGQEVEVIEGLKAGETIVVDGAFLLKAQAEKSNAGHGHGDRP